MPGPRIDAIAVSVRSPGDQNTKLRGEHKSQLKTGSILLPVLFCYIFIKHAKQDSNGHESKPNEVSQKHKCKV